VNFVFLGPPGAGKGTQAKQEAATLGVLYIATGDELRKAIAGGTPLGLKARRYTDSGQLVPDGVIIGLVRELLLQPAAAKGVIFDGFPRTLPQAEALDRVLAERAGAVDAVLYFDIPAAAVIGRLGGRRVCRRCGATYHVQYIPPRTAGQCDQCGGELYQRDDDKPETVRERLRVYEAQTASLLGHYEAKRLLVRIHADRTIEQVRDEVRAAMASPASGA
jgi:adenylate kinase